jgi:hypothetical protein
MSATSDNATQPIRLRAGRSLLAAGSDVDTAPVADAIVKLPAGALGPEGPRWTTFCATTGIQTGYGGFVYTLTVDDLGTNAKPIIVGLVPRTFTAFDAKLGVGGWGISSAGKAYCFNAPNGGAKSDAPGAVFDKGDKITVKVDVTRGSMVFIVESKKTKKINETSIKVPSFCGPWIVPAVSLASPGAQVTFETLQDTTPLDVYAAKLNFLSGGAADEFAVDCDGLGNVLLRLYRRMGDSDVVKTNAGTLTKADVRLRAALFGANVTPVWGRSPLPGMFDVDVTHRTMNAVYSELSLAIANDPSQSKKLRDLTINPPDAVKPLLRKYASPTTVALLLSLAIAQHAAPAAAANATPAPVTLSPNLTSPGNLNLSPRDNGDLVAQLKALTERVAALENQSHGGGHNDHEDHASFAPSVSTSNLRRGPSSKVVAKPATLTRRGSERGTKILVRPASKQAPRSKNPVTRQPVASSISTSNALLAILQRIRKMAHELRNLGEKGSPTDDDLKEINGLKDKMSKEKLQAARDVSALTVDKMSKALLEESKTELQNLLVDLVAEGDQHAGNIELFQALLKKVPVDFAAMAKASDLAAMAAYDGSLNYLKLILQLPNLDLDLVELVQCAIFNQSHRIPVTNLLVDLWGPLDCASVAEDIAESWQEFFEDIASEERALPREARAGRLELIGKLLKMKKPAIDPMHEGADGQTVFSRAAREGDIDLMTCLLTNAPSGIDVNHASSIDKTTALIQAVYKNQVTVVRALASLPKVDKNHSCDEGTALSIAKALKRHPDIVRCLEASS